MKYGCSTPFQSLKRFSVVLLLVALCEYSSAFGQTESDSAKEQRGIQEALSNESLDFVEFRNDIRLFTVMAAINVAGFDYEMPGKQMSPVRQSVRAELEGISRGLRTKLREFYLSHHTSDDPVAQSAYTSLALLIEGPPDFQVQEDLPNVPPEALAVMSFERLLPTFYQEGEISRLWMKYSDEYGKVLEEYRPVAETVIRRTLQYFRVPERVVLDSHIILIPDLLNFNDVVNARNQERTYYIVVGPAEDPESNFVQIQHEYLHFLIDPLMAKNGSVILKRRELLELAHAQPNLRIDFKDQFLLIVGESLVESIQSRLHSPKDVDKRQVELFRRGLVFKPYFDRAMEHFEKQTAASFPSYLQKILEDISASEIQKDAKFIDKSEVAILSMEERQQQEAEKKAMERELEARRRQFLTEAGNLMSNGRYSEAEKLLYRLLEQEPDNGNAYFYLGQIAGQQQQHDVAFSNYEKAQALSKTEDWLKAWALVRMGRYLAHQQRFEDARRIFERVIGMEGDLKGAKKDALDLIEMLPENEAN
jgi:tetratricopeptide (TPR) repeat protein